MSLAEKLKPHVKSIEFASKCGDTAATQIIKLYEMHRNCPSDPGAPALCEAAFDDWMRARRKEANVNG
jgi:hypothetical protein